MATNRIAGHGQHSHPVPTATDDTILMRDGHHEGTLITRIAADTYKFESRDNGRVSVAERCVLVRLTGVDVSVLSWPCGCDLDSPDGLALIGCDTGDELDGEILWDSDGSVE